ncbi:MAG: DUF1156 domain-containing protein [Candidatus Caldarchaeum sp.]
MDRVLLEEESMEHLQLFSKVSEEAKKEKLGNAKPPINQLLYWWTRKPLIVGRAVTLLGTISAKRKIAEVIPLLGLSNDKRAFKHNPNVDHYRKLTNNNSNNITVFDPFAGSGNLVFEACRLGLNVTVMEYNPVAYLILKATLEYPHKYGERLAEDVERYGKEVIERTRRELEQMYRRSGRKALHYLWCWCIKCPYCGQRFPLTNQMWLDKKKKKGYRVIPLEKKDFTIEIDTLTNREGSSFTQKEGEAICIKCRNVISYEHMTKDIAERRDKKMIAVVVKAQNGKDYETPSMEDENSFKEAKELLEQKWNSLLSDNLIPVEEIKESELFRITNYGLKRWYAYYTERQLLLMATLTRIIHEVCSEIKDMEYARVISTYLAFMLCKDIDYNCIGTRWHSRNTQIGDALSFRSPRIIYNFAETNPFEKTSGSLYNMLNDIVKAVKFSSLTIKNNSKILLGSAVSSQINNKFDVILTDPPYLDDVAYAELSEFFYVWLIRALKDYYPELPSSVPNDEDLVLSKGRFGSEHLAMEFYRRGMIQSFKNIYNWLKDDGLLIVFFAHSSVEAWNLLLEVLRNARFRISSSYAVHTESEENPLARGKTSFMSSIVVSCRKLTEEKEAYYEEVLPKVEDGISRIIDTLSEDELLSISITDLLIMTYGKVLEELTQYSKLKSYRADFKANFEDLINDARDTMLRKVVEKLVGRPPSALGPEASFMLTAKIFYRGSMPADEVLKVSKAYGVPVDQLVKKGYVERAGGRINAIPFSELTLSAKTEEISRDDIYQQLVYLLQIAHEKGATSIKTLLSFPNFRTTEIRQLVSLLIKHYRFLMNKGEELEDDEKEELRLLEAISDVMGQPVSKSSTLDSYI